MSNIDDLDNLIADKVRDFEIGELRRRRLSDTEREAMLRQTLGPKVTPAEGERFTIGDAAAGITSRSVWFDFRRVHFATIISISVGEQHDGGKARYWVDINCTLRRSFRISVPTILEADNFLVVLAQFMSLKIVPTVEDEMREERRAEELAASREESNERRHRRMEHLALRQQSLLNTLIQVESAPRVSFGIIG